ncbi:unnamed protein product [Parnassius apollo]|uniref:(apollo) hypothetical protein n=1 Tax=Parnassius apollo TaxID=110799 RepID=A0A8S3WVT8_PARAO|nr:unnamed protein product [Parnassius apollo]
MASSPTSLETQIDSFLEQFKRSASKAMEERMEWPDGTSPGTVVKSQSSCFALDTAAVDAGSFIKTPVFAYGMIAPAHSNRRIRRGIFLVKLHEKLM